MLVDAAVVRPVLTPENTLVAVPGGEGGQFALTSPVVAIAVTVRLRFDASVPATFAARSTEPLIEPSLETVRHFVPVAPWLRLPSVPAESKRPAVSTA